MLNRIQGHCHPIRLEDRPAIDTIRAEAGHTLSAHAFSSLYLWQRGMRLSVCIQDGAFFVRFGLRGEHAWFYPCGSEGAQMEFLRAGLCTPGFSMHYVRRRDMEFVQAHFPGRFRFQEARGDWEYICSRPRQEALPGKSFRNLRAKIHKAKKRYDWVVTPLRPAHREVVRQVVQMWQIGRETMGDSDVIMTGMDVFEELGFQGVLLSDAGDPKAFAFGSVIAPGVFDLHATKTLAPHIDSYLKWELYRRLPSEVLWINQEEDLDIPGLRVNKEESVPDHMVPLWKGYPV